MGDTNSLPATPHCLQYTYTPHYLKMEFTSLLYYGRSDLLLPNKFFYLRIFFASAIIDPILTKLFVPNSFCGLRFFWTKFFFDPNFFKPKIFWTENLFFNLNVFGPTFFNKIFRPKTLDQNFV